MFPSPKIPVHLFCLHHLPYLPQSVCEVRGWSEVTGGRCFLPSFEDDCKDEGRNSGKGKACFSAEAGCFTREATITSSRCWPQSGSSSGNGSSLSNPPLRPQNLNVELTPHLIFLQQHILQHVCLIKLNFACSRGVYSPYLHSELQ